MKILSELTGREEYFNILTSVSVQVDEVLKDFWKKDKCGDAKLIMYEPFLKRKWGAQKLRATLTWLSYCAFTNQNPRDLMPNDLAKLAASTELELWAEYTANWIFDNKGEVRTNPLSRKKAAVSAKSFLEDAVRIVYEVNPDYVPVVLDTSSNITRGWIWEFILDISNKEYLHADLSKYIKTYREQCATPAVSPSITACSDLAALYAGKFGSIKSQYLYEIFDLWGADIEILNDLGDFCLSGMSTDKVASDQFADIRNGALTPPIWFMYNLTNKKNKNFIESCVGKNELSNEEESRLVRILFESKSYDIISKGLKKAGRKYKKLIKRANLHDNGSSQLRQAAIIFESNKIYHTLKNNYKSVTGKDWNSENVNGEIAFQYNSYLDELYNGLGGLIR